MIENNIKNAIRDIHDFPKKGIVFKDITPILTQVDLTQEILNAFAQQLSHLHFDCLCAIESRGFFFGTLLAQKLKLPFIPVRKEGKLPGDTAKYHYDLEYGSATIEIQRGILKSNSKILLHDDLLATGGTAYAAAELIHSLGAKIEAFSFLVNLSFLEGEKRLQSINPNIFYLANY